MLTAGLNLEHHQSVSWTPDYTNVVNNLKSVSKFYKYTGSLTTPPCTEGVKWMVASRATLDISYQHALAFQSKFGFNARDTKPLKYDADPNWHHNRMAPQFFNPASGTQKPQINSSSFEYNGFKGSAYSQMTEKACGGNIQTPINFMPHHSDSTAIGLVLDNSAHKFPGLIYPGESKAGGKLKNVGDTLKFEPNLLTGAATFTRPDGVYDLLQFHFHSPSEHRVDGMEYPMEFHFVHKMGNNLAVIGGFAQLGATTSDFVLRLLEAGNNLEKGQSVSFIPEYAELVAKFKEIPTYFKYTGSLTTPPCSEGVKWLVAEEPIFTVTWQHWKEFMHKFEFTARDTQPLRYPSNYDWISMRKSDYYSKSDGVTAPTAPTAPTGGTTGGTTGGH
jgi:carbonic anhydrase